ncbi:MAG: hypothetical protein KBA46_01220 [Candidatus Omnitrophica bacterium]|nr:hypothetical protein [Candidatus Omnitrophota bacterium]
MNNGTRKKGQAVVELAIFGSVILFAFGMLLSYSQRQNDMQYVQMEAFRRALQKACQGPVLTEQTFDFENPSIGGGLGGIIDLIMPGKGASVQYTVLQNRRYADLSGDFGKGSPQTVSASSNVFWAVPFVGEGSESLTAIKINEDRAKVINNNGPLGILSALTGLTDDAISLSYQTSEINSDSRTQYSGTIGKTEDESEIVNRRRSQMKDLIHTKVNYKVKLGVAEVTDALDEFGLPTDITIQEGVLADVVQGAYYDPHDGGYKYSRSAVTAADEARIVERQRTWETPF